MDSFNTALITQEHRKYEAEGAIDKSRSERNPETFNFKASDHRRGHQEQKRVYHKYEQAKGENGEWKRKQDEEGPEECVKQPQDYPGKNECNCSRHLNAFKHIGNKRKQQQIHNKTRDETFHVGTNPR
jgi:hypothetical protein